MPNSSSTDDSQAIRAHIEQHIGPIEQAFSAPSHAPAPISVQHVKPSITRPVHTLVTSGMSARAMQVPDGVDAPRFLELMVTLPEDWKLDESSRTQDAWVWPLRLLQSLSYLPYESPGWIGWGHVTPNGTPPRAYAATTKLCGALVVPSLLVPTRFYELNVGDKDIHFYAVVPLYREELELNEKSGTRVLLERIVDRDLNDVVDPKRKNVAKKKFVIF